MKYTLILELVLSSSMAFIFTIAGNTAETRANEAHVDAAFSGSSSHDNSLIIHCDIIHGHLVRLVKLNI